MWRVMTCLIIIVVVLGQEATAQFFLSTPADGVQCYGRPVTLVCTHPMLPQEPEYPLDADVRWRRDGAVISTAGLTNKTNSRTTYLQFTITEDTAGNYTCFLENAVQGGTDESNIVPVRPLKPQPLSDIQNNTSLDTSIAFNWTHTPVECYKNRISYNVSWVNINNNSENGFSVTGGHMYNMTGLVANGNYTISVRAVVDGNVQSTAVSRNVTTGSPNVPHTIVPTPGVDSISVSWEHDDSCFEDLEFIVTCQGPGGQFPMSYPVTKRTFNIPDLNPGTNYSICISAVSTLDKRVQSTQKCLNQTTTLATEPPPTKAGNNAAIIAGPVGGWVTITVVTLIACML